MWIRKTEDELNEPIKKSGFAQFLFRLERNPFLLASIVFLSVFFICLFGELFIGVSPGSGRFNMGQMGPRISFSELPNRIPQYLKFSTISSIFIIIMGYLLRDMKVKMRLEYVCDKCNKLVEKDVKGKCNCGGEFVHIDKMKWIEDN